MLTAIPIIGLDLFANLKISSVMKGLLLESTAKYQDDQCQKLCGTITVSK